MNSNYDISKNICPDGTKVQAGSPCPSVPGRGMQTCPDGSKVPVGAKCPSFSVVCPDGSPVPKDGKCVPVPGRGMQTCPNGEIVHAGTRCPNSPRKYKLAVSDTWLYTSIGVAVAIGMVLVGALTGWLAKRKLTIA